MTAQYQRKIPVLVRLQPNDFTRLLSDEHSYAETGLTGQLMSDLTAALEERIQEQIGDALIAVHLNLPSVGTITVRDVLAKEGVQVPTFPTSKIQLDTMRNVVVEEFRFEPPVHTGYYGYKDEYKGWISGSPYIHRRQSMATRERHFVKFHGLFLPTELLPFRNEKVDACKCPSIYLTPDNSRYKPLDYVVWICNCCAKKYTCECFRGVLERVSKPGWQLSIPNYLFEKRIGLGNASPLEREAILRGGGKIERMAREDRQHVQYREGICNLCRAIPSTITYTSGDTIIKHYFPYIMAEAILSGIDTREAENRVRDRLGVPRIGEGWVSETHLYNLIRTLFPDRRVEREASPQWLGRMRFDIFLPEVGVAIEYQGEQHYRPIERFTGKKGFEKTRKRDRLKRQRAKEAGVKVVEFKYDEVLTDEMVRKRIDRAIKR